jgi:hypothetical protein
MARLPRQDAAQVVASNVPAWFFCNSRPTGVVSVEHSNFDPYARRTTLEVRQDYRRAEDTELARRGLPGGRNGGEPRL